MATRRSLSLKEKVNIISHLENNPSQSALARTLGVASSTISKIWNERQKIKDDFQTRGGDYKKCRRAQFEGVDSALFQWWSQKRRSNIYVTGPRLLEKALEIADQLGETGFKGSSGWLEKWKKRHHVTTLRGGAGTEDPLGDEEPNRSESEEKCTVSGGVVLEQSNVFSDDGSGRLNEEYFEELESNLIKTEIGDQSSLIEESYCFFCSAPVRERRGQCSGGVTHTDSKIKFKSRLKLVIKYLLCWGRNEERNQEVELILAAIMKLAKSANFGTANSAEDLNLCKCCQNLSNQICELQLQLEVIQMKIIRNLKTIKEFVTGNAIINANKSGVNNVLIDQIKRETDAECDGEVCEVYDVQRRFHSAVCQTSKQLNVPFIYLERWTGAHSSDFSISSKRISRNKKQPCNPVLGDSCTKNEIDFENNASDLDWQANISGSDEYDSDTYDNKRAYKRRRKSTPINKARKLLKSLKTNDSKRVIKNKNKPSSESMPLTKAQKLVRKLHAAKRLATLKKSKTIAGMRKHAKGKKILCEAENCSYSAKYIVQMIHHLREHETTEKNHSCPDCNQRFTTKQYFEVHLQCHDGLSKCDVCEEQIVPFKMRDHLETHQDKVFSCEYCGYCFGKYPTLINHLRKHRFVADKLKCELCSDTETKTYSTKNSLLEHLYKCHDFLDLKLECNFPSCTRSFFDIEVLRCHQYIHSDRFVCEVCKRPFQNRLSVENHFRIVHGGEKLWKCEPCSEEFASKQSLDKHDMLVHNRPKYTCDRCPNKEYLSLRGLKDHILWVHSRDQIQMFTCDVCSLEFPTRSKLAMHEVIHSDNKNFTCEICGFATRTNTLLKNHMLKHNGEKKFSCTYCPKRFAVRKYLNDHLRTHTLDKPFQCEVCGTAFNQKGSLNLHKKKHGHGHGTVARRPANSKPEADEQELEDSIFLNIPENDV